MFVVMFQQLLTKFSQTENVILFFVPFDGRISGNSVAGFWVFRSGGMNDLLLCIETFVGNGIPTRIGCFADEAFRRELIPDMFDDSAMFG